MMEKSSTALLSVAAGFAGVTVAVLAVVAARFGWASPYGAFRAFGLAAFTGGILGVGLGLFALLGTWSTPSHPQRRAAWAGTFIGAGLMLSLAMAGAGAAKVPPIHDLTTDLDDPPAFTRALELPGNESRDLSYPHGDPETSGRQSEAYPDLESIRLGLAPAEAFEAVRAAVLELGWSLTWDDAALGLVEAHETSRFFRFVDDVVVRIRPDGEGGSVVDLRSTSRVGISDLGVNAERIRRFVEALRKEL